MYGTTTKAISKTSIQKLENPILSFKRTNKTAVKNSKILAALNGDLGAEIATQNDIPLNYRSELRDKAALT